MEVDEKDDKLQMKPDSFSTNVFGFNTPIKSLPAVNSTYSAKLERTRNWVISSKPSLLQSLLKNNNKFISNQSYIPSPSNISQLSWPIDPQMCDNTAHVEPLEDLEGSSILSEFESYYTAQSEMSVSNNPMNIPESSGDDSSRTSILEMDNLDEISATIVDEVDNSMQEK